MKKLFRLFLIIAFLGAGPVAQAQQAKKVPRIGYLTVRAGPSERDEAFRQGLRDLGYVERQTIVIEWRYANGTDRLPEMAAELVRLNLDVFVAEATPAVQAMANATRTAPIVMAAAADPVGSGLVASLVQPGGNITGLSLILPELGGKRLELLREVLPRVARVAFLAHGGNPAHRLFVKEAQDAAKGFKIRIQPLVIGGPEEFEGAFSAMIKERAGALVVQPQFVIVPEHLRRIVDLATRNRLPTVSDFMEFADAGGLMSYGPPALDPIRRAAVFVDKILKGTKPTDIPVEQPMRFELVINLKTAKHLGLTIPQWTLMKADKVIK
ncbi:MAG: ABC transporter substrate-binding protein [Deltaproteobacteria bacterium]|nr:ABC transporter substrate-binding protein [Deltaproteobacteria bacterium]